MGVVGLILLVVVLILLGVGIAIGLVGCAVAAVLLGLGMISSSVFIGFRTGRTAAGIRAFFLQCGFFGGVPAGAVCAWLAMSLFDGRLGDWWILIYGAIGGACAGLLLGFLLDVVSKQLHAWASARLLVSRAESADAVKRKEVNDW